ncbi:MAG TPA: hypothetical protein VFA93_03210 [Patescibacteria group bacterium]|nr:hypothetical protein [Patescibacteria group bacterium]
MQKTWIWGAVLVLILVVGYLGRHQIRTLFNGSPTPAPVAKTTPTPAVSVTNGIVMTKTDPTKGNFLTDPKGMTLYVFDKDQQGVSNCNGTCAAIWPPYGPGSTVVSSLPANFTTIKRNDGTMQYTYKGMPLYYYQKDTKPGDILGDGVNGTWHLVKP